MRGGAEYPVRLRFTKRGKIRWISHRDLARAFERAFRIAGLPLAFSEGFSPHPKVSFGLALGVGHESDAEYLDVELVEEVPLEPMAAALAEALPEGIEVTGAAVLGERAPALQEAVTAVEWRVEVAGAGGEAPMAAEELAGHVAAALGMPALETTRTRKGKRVVEDVRPVIRRVEVVGAGSTGVLTELELATQPRGAKPGEVLAAIAAARGLAPLAEQHVLRTHQWIERDGARLEPLDADPRPHAREARAS